MLSFLDHIYFRQDVERPIFRWFLSRFLESQMFNELIKDLFLIRIFCMTPNDIISDCPRLSGAHEKT